jgi:hydrogenase maturation protease
MRRVTILACGEQMRGDDGVAAAVVEALPAVTRAMAEIRLVGQLMPDDLLGVRSPIILLDAVHGPSAGTVVDMPLSALSKAHEAGISPASSHALPLHITLGIVDQLGCLPEGRLVGIAGERFELASDLSPAVREAVATCAGRLHHWVRVLAHGSRARACA